jgi:hypothetical protein
MCDPEQATLYCKNDKIYFCEECSEKIHGNRDNAFFIGHDVVDAREAPLDYGLCSEHKRKNEYYNYSTARAYCIVCVVEGA